MTSERDGQERYGARTEEDEEEEEDEEKKEEEEERSPERPPEGQSLYELRTVV